MPIGLGVTIFGIVYGLLGRQSGIPLWVVLGMSLFVFAGSSQMIATEMLATAADPFSIMVTVLIVNLRHLVMAADLSQYVRHEPVRSRAFSAFFLTDEAYAVSYTHFRQQQTGSTAYFFGCGLNIYVFWALSSVLGFLGGELLPAVIQPAMSFAMAAAFLSMLIPLIKDKPTLCAVLTAAFTAVLGSLYLPGKWYILLAAFAGSTVGFVLDGRQERKKAGDAI